MSWLDKIDTGLTIKTGDGEEFKPLWLNATKSREFNVSRFDFVNVQGTLVKRSEPRGREYSIEIYFTGEDHLDDAERFDDSSLDKRPWTISHPFYGSVLVQPQSLLFDNRDLNVTKITGTVVETITEDNPRTALSKLDKVNLDKQSLDELNERFFFYSLPSVEAKEKSALLKNIDLLYNKGKKAISDTTNFEEYTNFFNQANAAIIQATSLPLEAVRAAIAFFNYPIQFVDSVKNRINVLKEQFGLLRTTMVTGNNPVSVDRRTKFLYENQATTVIGAFASAAVTPIEPNEEPEPVTISEAAQISAEEASINSQLGFNSRTDIVNVIATITENYNQLIEDLDALQGDNGGDPENYIPTFEVMMQLDSVINASIAALLELAVDGKQERRFFLEEDTNVINLAHRLYGLKPDDSTIDQLINDNAIGLNELLGLRKGREIVYYA